MKKILGIVLVFILASCSKDQPAPSPSQNCSINMALFKDITWHHITGALADLKFASDGQYYENGSNDGTWSQSNGCDSVYVTRLSNSFYLQILSLKTDTLKLRNSVFGDVTYYR